MTIHAFIDGASRGNPGESGIGVLFKNEKGKIVYAIGGYIGSGTNNIAEYVALLACLKKAKEMKCSKLVVHSDSELVVKQVKGEYKVRDAEIKKQFQRVMKVLKFAPYRFEIKHVRRERNREADILANAGIDARIKLKI